MSDEYECPEKSVYRGNLMSGIDGSNLSTNFHQFTPSITKLNVDMLYPRSTLQYKLPIILKVFKKDFRRFFNDSSVSIESKLSEASSILNVLEKRKASTASFVTDELQQLFIEFYALEYTEAINKLTPGSPDLKKLRYIVSVTGAWCIRNNSNIAQSVVNRMLAVVESDEYDEQTRMEFADCLELNATCYPIAQNKAFDYINSVVGEVRVKRLPIKGSVEGLALYEAVTSGVKEIKKEPSILGTFMNKIKSRLQSVFNPSIKQKEEEKKEEDDSHIYASTQNVHKNKISNVIYKKLEMLQDLPFNSEKTFDEVKQQFVYELNLYKIVKQQSDFDLINMALARIASDPSVFHPSKLMLKDVFMRVYERITTSENFVDLLQRLVEELMDTAEFCASGYCSRIINVLSGHEDVDFDISSNQVSIHKEVYEYCKTQLQVAISQVDNEDYQSMIINGLSEPKNTGVGMVSRQFIEQQQSQWVYDINQDYPNANKTVIVEAVEQAIKRLTA